MITDPNQIRAEIKAGSWVKTNTGLTAQATKMNDDAVWLRISLEVGLYVDVPVSKVAITAILAGPPCVEVSRGEIESIISNYAESEQPAVREALQYFCGTRNIAVKETP